MNKKFRPQKSTYLFYILVILLFGGSSYIFKAFDNISADIERLNLNSNVQYVDNISTNIAELIKSRTGEKIVKSLKKNKLLQNELDSHLQLFISRRYRYVYVVKKEEKANKFQFLLDGAKKNKSEFLEDFQPSSLYKWIEVYKTKKALYFKHRDIKDLWLTYLQPVVINNKVEAIVVIDFSLQEYHYVEGSLDDLAKIVKMFTIFLLLMFVVISILAVIDRRRIYLLQNQTEEIQNFNITLQKRIHDEVAKNREKDKQLLEQSRLAQMGEMIGMIAHQWRQPINAISATSIAINMKAQMEQLDNENAIQLADKISELTQHLSKTIDDFRDFFKPIKDKKDINYADLIKSTLDIVQTSIENKNIEIITEIQSDIVFHTYINELKQVLLNLIKNAEDVLIEKKIENPYIKIVAKDNRLSVSDNAGGVPEEIIDKIFDPYFSTKTLNGTGLGLYMSKTIVQEHCGGKLSVKNDENGAVFTVEIISTKP